jgi:hypothetical protein
MSTELRFSSFGWQLVQVSENHQMPWVRSAIDRGRTVPAALGTNAAKSFKLQSVHRFAKNSWSALRKSKE